MGGEEGFTPTELLLYPTRGSVQSGPGGWPYSLPPPSIPKLGTPLYLSSTKTISCTLPLAVEPLPTGVPSTVHFGSKGVPSGNLTTALFQIFAPDPTPLPLPIGKSLPRHPSTVGIC